MTAFSQVRDLFDRALDLPLEQRAGFLDHACGSDELLRDELERLVGAYERLATHFATETAPSPHFQSGTPDGDPLKVVGPYRIIREIAHGGMGAVYLGARDDDEYKKRVAVKLLRRGVTSEAVVRRFRQERQMLASIDHPFIAKLLDGGSTREGLPYFVMEYVDGQPIDVYCDTRRLSVTHRLDLFRKVCAAVHFAHQNLIVHRDLKPSNVLVSTEGSPKLVDFGIAKPLNPEMFALTVDGTAFGGQMMTPEYASPEQIRGDAVTTVSDVYSLGVLLYELLTGHRPYAVQGHQLPEIARVICEVEPVRPSTIVGQTENVIAADGTVRTVTPEGVSLNREASPDKLRRDLQGDLDNIVMMAMRKEPQKRYASVDHFADDIRRYQEGLPVRARKGTWTYKASKFVRRHKLGLAAATVLVLSLVSFSVLTARERRRAEEAAADANAVIEFLTTTLAAVDPRVAQGSEPTVRDMLDEAEKRLSDSAGLQEVAIRKVIAESRFQLGHFRQARDHYVKLLASFTASGGEKHPDTVAALVGLASSQVELNEFREAEANARLAVEHTTGMRGAASRLVVKALNTLGRALLELNTLERLGEAEAILARAADLASAGLGPGNPNRLATGRLLAELRMSQSRYREAEPLARENYRVALATLGPRHPSTIQALELLSTSLLSLSQYVELESIQRAHAAETRRILGADHPMTLQVEHTVAETLRSLDRFEDAKNLYLRVLADKTRVLGEMHRSTLATRHNLALLYKNLKEPGKAEAMLREIARLKREALGPRDADTLLSEMMIALTLYEQGRLEESRDAYAEVLPRIKEALGESASEHLVGTVNYAGLLYRLGDLPRAEQTLRDSLAAHQRAYGDHYYGTYHTMTELGTTLVHMKRYPEAEQHLLTALAGFREVFKNDPNHQRVRQALDRLAKLYVAWDKPEKAAEFQLLLKKAAETAAPKTPIS